MFYIGTPTTQAPNNYLTSIQAEIYTRLAHLDIPFERVDTDPGITMEQCVAIGEALQQPVVKTLLLCNRQRTQFYILAMPGDKPFVTKDFSAALGVSRVSFAPEEKLSELLGTTMGATTILSIWHDRGNAVRLVIDVEVLRDSYFACTDATATCFLRIPTDALMKIYLPSTGHTPEVINL